MEQRVCRLVEHGGKKLVRRLKQIGAGGNFMSGLGLQEAPGGAREMTPTVAAGACIQDEEDRLGKPWNKIQRSEQTATFSRVLRKSLLR